VYEDETQEETHELVEQEIRPPVLMTRAQMVQQLPVQAIQARQATRVDPAAPLAAYEAAQKIRQHPSVLSGKTRLRLSILSGKAAAARRSQSLSPHASREKWLSQLPRRSQGIRLGSDA
jgi:hypothetical protein